MFLIADQYWSCLTPMDLDEILMIHDVAMRPITDSNLHQVHWSWGSREYLQWPHLLLLPRWSGGQWTQWEEQEIGFKRSLPKGKDNMLPKLIKHEHPSIASQTMWEDHQFPDDQEDSYLAMNDLPPSDRCKTSRIQVHHVVIICFLCISRKMPIRTVISGNGFLTSRHISLWCSIWRSPTHQESVYHVEEMEFIDPQTVHIDQCSTWPIVGTSIHSGPSIVCNNGMRPSLKTPLSD